MTQDGTQRSGSGTAAARDGEAFSGPVVFDRARGVTIRETVLGDALLKWAYASLSGRLCRPLLFATRLPSILMGMYFDSRLSRGRIASAIRTLELDTAEFRDPPESFRTFNEFFTRHLRPGARPYAEDPRVLLSPADCRLLVYPALRGGSCFPVKGVSFTVERLLGPLGADAASVFDGGSLAIFRLCPADYHRYHYPAAGRTLGSRRCGVRLDSVSPVALAAGVRVFSENRRVVSLLELEVFGRAAYIEVGAFGVAGIVQTHREETFERFAEKGYFTFGGSTIVMVFRKGAVAFDEDIVRRSEAGIETLVKAGERIGAWPGTTA